VSGRPRPGTLPLGGLLAVSLWLLGVGLSSRVAVPASGLRLGAAAAGLGGGVAGLLLLFGGLALRALFAGRRGKRREEEILREPPLRPGLGPLPALLFLLLLGLGAAAVPLLRDLLPLSEASCPVEPSGGLPPRSLPLAAPPPASPRPTELLPILLACAALSLGVGLWVIVGSRTEPAGGTLPPVPPPPGREPFPDPVREREDPPDSVEPGRRRVRVLYARLVGELGRAGLRVRGSWTPEGLAARAGIFFSLPPEPLRALVRLFEQARFGPREMSREECEAAERALGELLPLPDGEDRRGENAS